MHVIEFTFSDLQPLMLSVARRQEAELPVAFRQLILLELRRAQRCFV
jgi:hypothetical protein